MIAIDMEDFYGGVQNKDFRFQISDFVFVFVNMRLFILRGYANCKLKTAI
jgi:hypothetical protein